MATKKRAKRTENVPKKIGARMRKWRKSKELTASAVARKIGVTKGHISSAETGGGNLSLPLFLRYCKAIGVPVSRIVEDQIISKEKDFERLAETARIAVGTPELKWLASLSQKEGELAMAAARDAVELVRLRKSDRSRHKAADSSPATLHRIPRKV